MFDFPCPRRLALQRAQLATARSPGHSGVYLRQIWCCDLMLITEDWLSIYLMLLCISLPNDFRLIFIKQMVHTIAMPFYGTSKLVSKTSRDDAPCPPRGLFDAPSRSCWQLEPLKKNVRLVTPLQGYLRWVFGLIHEEMHVWCGLGMFGRSMAVSFVLSSIWERYDNMYLRCQKVSTLHEEYSKIYVIHIYTVFDEMYTCNKVYMNLIHLILTGDLWPPLTVDHSLNSLWYIL